jgi:hypothetical protein
LKRDDLKLALPGVIASEAKQSSRSRRHCERSEAIQPPINWIASALRASQ